MNFTKTALTAVLLAGSAMMMPTVASAFPANPAIQAPSMAEQVACRTVRERIVTPSGRVIFRSSRVCTPGIAPIVRPIVRPRPVCTVVRERTVTPSGRVIVRSVRRCG